MLFAEPLYAISHYGAMAEGRLRNAFKNFEIIERRMRLQSH